MKRGRKAGYLGVTKAQTSEKRRIRELLADGYKQVSREAYRTARFALVMC